MDTLEKNKAVPQPEAKPSAEKTVLRARPTKGEVDDEALSREFIRRFPKLRAALAK